MPNKVQKVEILGAKKSEFDKKILEDIPPEIVFSILKISTYYSNIITESKPFQVIFIDTPFLEFEDLTIKKPIHLIGRGLTTTIIIRGQIIIDYEGVEEYKRGKGVSSFGEEVIKT